MRPYPLLDIQRTSYCPLNDVYHNPNLDILLMTKLEQRLDVNVQKQILVRLKSIAKEFMHNFGSTTRSNVLIATKLPNLPHPAIIATLPE